MSSGVNGYSRMHRDRPIKSGAAFIVLLLLLASGSPSPASTNLIRIAAGIAPHAWIASEIGGDHVKAVSLASSGTDPHTYEPSPRQIEDLYRADIIIASGMPFEERIFERLPSASKSRIIRLGEPCSDKPARHKHSGPAHNWLSPGKLKGEAASITEALCAIDPDNSGVYTGAMEALVSRIMSSGQKIREILAGARTRRIYVFHPALDAFTEEFGLEQVAVEHEGKSPSPKQLREVIKQAKQDGVTVLYAHPQFDRKGASAVSASIGAQLVDFDPLASNVIRNMEFIAESFAEHNK